MKSKLLVLISMLVIASVLVTSCTTNGTTAVSNESSDEIALETGESSTEPQKPDKLTFWMMKTFVDEGNASMEKQVEEFTKVTGIDVDFELIPIDDLSTRWSAAIESGNVPDLSYFDYNNLGAFQSQGLLLEIDDAISETQALNGNLNPALLKSMYYEGHYYGIPMWAEPTVLYYRTDLFEQAGIANPPDTWEEFIDDANILTDPDNGIYGAGFGIGMNLTDSEWWFRDIIWSYGGSLMAEDGKKATINTPEFKLAASFIVDFFTKENVTPPGVIGWDDSGNNKAYLAGQVAMIINTGSVYNAIFNTEDYPDLRENTELALVPGGPEGRFITGISNGLAIFKESDNPYWAKQLMIWMMDKEWQRDWMKSGGYLIVPAYPELAEDEFWQTNAGRVFAEVPEYYAFLGYPGDFTQSAGVIANSFVLSRNFQEVIVNGQPLDEMLVDLQVEVTDILNQ
ncbi:MAG: sugar ABC transporter substrate-binding protein [Anaerolineaceae bacterium]|nr:sugar ABC transporter substrate-binding protein [Anaerolineaceae bacterium]